MEANVSLQVNDISPCWYSIINCSKFTPSLSGDQRVNQYTSLTVMHIVWVRLHNKYANQLALINPKWDDEKLYQETKRIVVALVQHITYNEYLPSVLGRFQIF